MVVPRRRPTASSRRLSEKRARERLARLCLTLLALLIAVPALVIAVYRYVPPPVTPLMLIRLAQGEQLTYRFRPIEEISPNLARAAIASEDNLFCTHWGFDLEALWTEVERARAGERPRGASTISQQLAKNLFLWPGRGLTRKVLEAWLAPQLELLLGKTRILELYLNVVEFGPGTYGAEAASRRWFAKSAAELSRHEAARLVVILPAPREWRATSEWAGERARVIEQRMNQLGSLLNCAP